MTAAQKLAKENFKKAIAYRKISGCTLKEAFAKIYNKKTAPIKKAASKVKKLVKKAKDAYYEGYNEAARKSNPLMVKKRKVGAVAKKKAVKKAAPKKVARKVVKKAAPKRSVSLHKDTKSHNVNIRVISGYKKIGNLDEINKGDILVSHWGYDQTNVDFFMERARFNYSYTSNKSLFGETGTGGFANIILNNAQIQNNSTASISYMVDMGANGAVIQAVNCGFIFNDGSNGGFNLTDGFINNSSLYSVRY